MRAPLLLLLAAAPLWVHEAHVIRVIDGDTFVATILLRPELTETRTIRLPCGNAAELRADGGGIAAKAALTHALEGATSIRTEWRQEKYGRLLAAPYRADGGSICAELLDAGAIR